jgi:hypothetical protein
MSGLLPQPECLGWGVYLPRSKFWPGCVRDVHMVMADTDNYFCVLLFCAGALVP